MAIKKLDYSTYNEKDYNNMLVRLRGINGVLADSNIDINYRLQALKEKHELEETIKRYNNYYRATNKQKAANNNNHVTVKVSDLISDNFISLFRTDRSYRILKGGRSSLKSSAVSIQMVLNFIQDDNANCILFRKVAKYLSTSIYEQIKWAIYVLQVENEFEFMKSPLRIHHKRTGTAFYFYGVDDPIKIKSAKIAKGYVTDLWFEEAAEFTDKQEIDTVVDTFIRQILPDGKTVHVTYTYNPPRNPYIWINEWVAELEETNDVNYFIHHSDYTEDTKGFLSPQFLDKVAQIKETDPDYHEWMYKGKVIGLGDTIYNSTLINRIDSLKELGNDTLLVTDLSIDTGYSVSATTFLYIGLTVKGKVVLLDTYYYSPVNKINKKAPSDFSNDLKKFMVENAGIYNAHTDYKIIDSADGALRNQYHKDHYERLLPARKKNKIVMIENVQELLAANRLYVLNTPNNKIFLEEHKKYQWDEKTLNTPEPKVVKIDDHTCDAFQYYVNYDLIKLGLRA